MLEKIKKYLWRKKTTINFSDGLRTEPVSRIWGTDRGTPIDRYYIEKFLREHSQLIRGNVLEISENTYTKRFGSEVISSSILTFDKDAPGNVICGDLTDRKTLPVQKYDCFIATQTLNFIQDVGAAVSNAEFLLSENGVFLGTVASLAQISRYDYERWGDYWRFTDMGIGALLKKTFSRVSVFPMGNMAVVKLLLDGAAVEDLPSSEVLDIMDKDYSVVIGFEARK